MPHSYTLNSPRKKWIDLCMSLVEPWVLRNRSSTNWTNNLP